MAFEICKPGTMYRQIGYVICKYIEESGLKVTRANSGHGIGKLFYSAPKVPHYKS